MKLLAGFFSIVLLANSASAQATPTVLTGVWRVTEIKTTGPGAATISNPQPGLFIFTGTHYSLMYIDSGQPRTAITAQATAAEFRAAWGPFTAAAGTYQISGGNVTFRPLVAKNPQVMAPGNIQVDAFKLMGNTLTLTRMKNGDTTVANPTTITFTRVE